MLPDRPRRSGRPVAATETEGALLRHGTSRIAWLSDKSRDEVVWVAATGLLVRPRCCRHQHTRARPRSRRGGPRRRSSVLLALLRPWIRRVRERPFGRVVAALVTKAETDRGFAAEYCARFVEPRRRRRGSSSDARSSAARSRRTRTLRSCSTCSTAPATTGSYTATPRSPTASCRTSSTPRSRA